MAKVKIKAMTDIADKWSKVTPDRAAYYEAGVKNPLENWEEATIAAMASYKAAVSAADIGKRQAGGVKRAGFAKWQRKSVDLGVDRFGPGVRAAKEDYTDGYSPFQAVLAGLELPARKPRGDPANQDRTKEIGAALFKKRLALVGAGA